MHPLLLILLASVVVRVALWAAWKDPPLRIVDAQAYNRLAIVIVEQGEYLTPQGKPFSLRPPLYPAFVAGVYSVFGLENYAAVRMIQALLGLGTVVLVYVLGAEVYSRRVGLWASGWCAFYPSFLGFNNLLLSETLFTLFVAAITVVTLIAIKRRSMTLMPVLGVLLGLGALVRSILWLCGPLIAIYLILVWGGRWRTRVAATFIMMTCFLATIAPWAYRNTQHQRTLTIIDCMGGRNAMMGNYEHTPLERSWATIDIAQGKQAWHRVLAAETPNYSSLTQGQLDKVAMKHGIRFVLDNPWLTLKRDVVRFFNFWQLERTLVAGAAFGHFGELPKPAILTGAALVCGSYALAVFAGVFGVLMTPVADRRIHWLLVFTIAFPCVTHTLIFAHSRYHLPIMPIVLVFATSALLRMRNLWSRRRELTFALSLIACLLLIVGWTREIVMVDLAGSSGLF